MTVVVTPDALTITAPEPRKRRRGWGWTAGGVAIIVVMLFPVYWMLNVSLQPAGSAVGTSLFPFHLSFAGYAKALNDQGGHLATSLIIALGSVVFSLLIAAPAAYGLALFRIKWADAMLLGILISQMIPGIVVANALYSCLLYTSPSPRDGLLSRMP